MKDKALEAAFQELKKQLLNNIKDDTLVTPRVVEYLIKEAFEYGFNLGVKVNTNQKNTP